MYNLDLKVEIFKEDDAYVAICPSLNVSSYGDTVDAARNSLVEALEAFIEECAQMGTIEEVLEEAGFKKTSQTRYARLPMKEENLALAIQ